VAATLADAKGTFTFPDGKKQDFAGKAGESQYEQAASHLPENTSDQGMDVIVIELKGKTAKAATKPAKAEPAKVAKK
jgi:hypothetical protein